MTAGHDFTSQGYFTLTLATIGANIHEANYVHGMKEQILPFRYVSQQTLRLGLGCGKMFLILSIWLVAFMASYIAVYLLNFALWGAELTPINLLVELLPVIGILALNIGFRLKNASDVRKCGLISSPAWLIYNIVVGSWGASLCEVLTLISIFAGMFRLDKKKD